MKNNVGILIPSYNRVDLCNRCVGYIRKQSNIKIFITVEKDQFKDYLKMAQVYKNVYVIPLVKHRKGVSYSIHFGLRFLWNLGCDYVLRTDDDVNINFDIKKFFKVKIKHKNIAWLGCWFSIYDFFYKGKEKFISEKDDILESVASLYSRCYIIDLGIIMKMGNWDWRYRYWDDYDMVTRLKLNGYDIAVHKESLARSLSARFTDGGVKSSLDDIKKVADKNMKLLKNKFGDRIASYRINKKGKPLMRYNWNYVKSGNVKLKTKRRYKNMMDAKTYNVIYKIVSKQTKL